MIYAESTSFFLTRLYFISVSSRYYSYQFLLFFSLVYTVSCTFESSRVKENKSLIAERERGNQMKMRFQAVVVSRCVMERFVILQKYYSYGLKGMVNIGLTMWRKFKIRRLYKIFLNIMVIIPLWLFELWQYLNDTMNFEVRVAFLPFSFIISFFNAM